MLAPVKHAKPKRVAAKRPEARRPKSEPRRRVRLDVDARRAQLVELGLSQFSSRTFDEISIDDIAREAGISKGLLYHYFPTKRAFYVACVRESAARLVAGMDDVVPKDGPLVDANGAPTLEGLSAGIDAYLTYVRSQGRAYTALMRSGAGVDRELATIVDATRSTLLARLTHGLAEVFPPETIESPTLQIALHGWVGLAEAASIAWVEASVEAEGTSNAIPSALQIRTLLTRALVAIVQSAM